mmetsp:Transcript_1870/g.7329  ORF Transcript_1870/g.7329 Transcript_1870/m.7329 type:complete len:297 (+) Transcript_1870:377-1267(+)
MNNSSSPASAVTRVSTARAFGTLCERLRTESPTIGLFIKSLASATMSMESSAPIAANGTIIASCLIAMRMNSGLEGQKSLYFSFFRLNASRTPPGKSNTASPCFSRRNNAKPLTGTAPKDVNDDPPPTIFIARRGGFGSRRGSNGSTGVFFTASRSVSSNERGASSPPNPSPPPSRDTTGCAKPRRQTSYSRKNSSTRNPRSGAIVWWFPTSKIGREPRWRIGTALRPRTIFPSGRVLKNTGDVSARKPARLSRARSMSAGDGGSNFASRVITGASARFGTNPFRRAMVITLTPGS